MDCMTSDRVLFTVHNIPEILLPTGWLKLWTDREIDIIYNKWTLFNYVSRVKMDIAKSNESDNFNLTYTAALRDPTGFLNLDILQSLWH